MAYRRADSKTGEEIMVLFKRLRPTATPWS
jgi:hypothetical protein